MKIKTLPIIRHLRWFYYWRRLEGKLNRSYELGLGVHPNQNDMDYLDGVWEGKW